MRWHCCSWRGRCWPASGGESSQALPLLHPPTRRWLRSLVAAPLLLAAALSGSTTEEQSPASREIRRDSPRRARVTTKSDWSTRADEPRRAELSRDEPMLLAQRGLLGACERAFLFTPPARPRREQASCGATPAATSSTYRAGPSGPSARTAAPPTRCERERVWSGKRAFESQLTIVCRFRCLRPLSVDEGSIGSRGMKGNVVWGRPDVLSALFVPIHSGSASPKTAGGGGLYR